MDTTGPPVELSEHTALRRAGYCKTAAHAIKRGALEEPLAKSCTESNV